MSELQEVCDSLNAINGDIIQMAQILHARSRSLSRVAADVGAAARSAEGAGLAALARTAAALNAAAAHCGKAAQSLAGAAREGQAFVARTVGGGAAEPLGPMEAELQELRNQHPSRQQTGDFSEAAAAGFLELVLDYGLISQHNPGDKPQGIDIQAISPEERLQSIEVKGTTRENARKPRTSKTKTGRQSSAEWIRSRAADGPVHVASADAVGEDPDQIASRLVHVNLKARTISLWSVDMDGMVASTPDIMAPLDEVVHAIDWPNEGDG